jgi:hypothetical protein
MFNNDIAEKVSYGTMAYEEASSYSSATEVSNALDDKADVSDLNAYADSVKYDSTNHSVEFYHGTTAGTKVFEFDASPFIIDGMVENVEVKDVTQQRGTSCILDGKVGSAVVALHNQTGIALGIQGIHIHICSDVRVKVALVQVVHARRDTGSKQKSCRRNHCFEFIEFHNDVLCLVVDLEIQVQAQQEGAATRIDAALLT